MKIHEYREAKLARFRFLLDEWYIRISSLACIILGYHSTIFHPPSRSIFPLPGSELWESCLKSASVKHKEEEEGLTFPFPEFPSLAVLKGDTCSFQGRGKYTLSNICSLFVTLSVFLNSFTAVAQNFLSVSWMSLRVRDKNRLICKLSILLHVKARGF